MSLEKLFESLDEKVFTADLKEAIETEFNEAVQTKSATIADEKIEEEIDRIEEKSQDYISFLNEKAEEYTQLREQEMLETLDKYLSRVVNEFLEEAKESLEESAKSEKADMLIEAFDSMLVASGVEISRIAEAKEDTEVESRLEESTKKYDDLVSENIDLQNENERLIKMGVISEMTEGLSIVEKEKFQRLANLVEFSMDEKFAEKLETIKESVKGSVSSKDQDTTNESVNQDSVSWSHLI